MIKESVSVSIGPWSHKRRERNLQELFRRASTGGGYFGIDD
jgi:hypothetical protein